MTADAYRRKQELKQSIIDFAQELLEGPSDRYLRFLSIAGRFRRYSLFNQILIVKQCPTATMVAGWHGWSKQNRHVKKGERAIYILAPNLRAGADPDTGEEIKVLAGFHPTAVFDLAQTEGEPIPEAEDPLRIDDDSITGDTLMQIVKSCPLPVELKDTGAAYGRTDGEKIYIRAGEPPATQLATLLHEWAHTILHFGQERDARRRDRAAREIEAETSAHTVGLALGIRIGAASRDYLLHYKADPQAVLASLKRIHRASRQILDAIEAALKPPLPVSG